MSPKTGRPKSENPKNSQITVRLDNDTIGKLNELCEIKQTSKSEVVREGIERIYEDEKK